MRVRAAGEAIQRSGADMRDFHFHAYYFITLFADYGFSSDILSIFFLFWCYGAMRARAARRDMSFARLCAVMRRRYARFAAVTPRCSVAMMRRHYFITIFFSSRWFSFRLLIFRYAVYVIFWLFFFTSILIIDYRIFSYFTFFIFLILRYICARLFFFSFSFHYFDFLAMLIITLWCLRSYALFRCLFSLIFDLMIIYFVDADYYFDADDMQARQQARRQQAAWHFAELFSWFHFFFAFAARYGEAREVRLLTAAFDAWLFSHSRYFDYSSLYISFSILRGDHLRYFRRISIISLFISLWYSFWCFFRHFLLFLHFDYFHSIFFIFFFAISRIWLF